MSPEQKTCASRVGSGAASGKVILLGEHAVVYGQPALACPVLLETTVSVRAADGPLSLKLPTQQEPALWAALEDGRLRAALEQALGLFDLPHAGVTLEIQSALPMGRGLGSSAALSIALLRALSAYTERHLTESQLLEAGLKLETCFHGTPSGLDHTCAALAKPLLFTRSPWSVTPITLKDRAWLLLMDSGGERSTAALVAGVRARLAEAPSLYQPRIEAIGRLVREGREALEAGDWVRLGACMQQNQVELEILGVSTPGLERLIRVALDAGALGAKLTGAGGGGMAVALFRESPEILASQLQAEGIPAWSVELGPRARG